MRSRFLNLRYSWDEMRTMDEGLPTENVHLVGCYIDLTSYPNTFEKAIFWQFARQQDIELFQKNLCDRHWELEFEPKSNVSRIHEVCPHSRGFHSRGFPLGYRTDLLWSRIPLDRFVPVRPFGCREYIDCDGKMYWLASEKNGVDLLIFHTNTRKFSAGPITRQIRRLWWPPFLKRERVVSVDRLAGRLSPDELAKAFAASIARKP